MLSNLVSLVDEWVPAWLGSRLSGLSCRVSIAHRFSVYGCGMVHIRRLECDTTTLQLLQSTHRLTVLCVRCIRVCMDGGERQGIGCEEKPTNGIVAAAG